MWGVILHSITYDTKPVLLKNKQGSTTLITLFLAEQRAEVWQLPIAEDEVHVMLIEPKTPSPLPQTLPAFRHAAYAHTQESPQVCCC